MFNSKKAMLLAVMLLMGMMVLALPAAAQLKTGDAAPAFSLKDASTQKTVSLSDFLDKKIVIVHFWKSK